MRFFLTAVGAHAKIRAMRTKRMKRTLIVFAAAAFILSVNTLATLAEGPVLNLTKYKDESSIKAHQDKLVTVKLRGKINHAGDPDYHAIVAGVTVWLAEYPSSKELNVSSDDKGWWTMNVLKHKGAGLKVSLIYAKPGWVTTKSNVLTVTDRDDTDIAMQYIDPTYYRLLVKPLLEVMLKGLLPPGADSTLKNAVVVTVGKSWASIHDDRLPHGDPGATVNSIPGAVRPLYFDESVKPNPAYTHTSVDGGVAWLNVPKGTHVVKAFKEGVKYRDVEFAVTDADAENGVVLYIASPPDSIQGTNDSPPGKN
jgi:hypothetical protein